MALAHISYEIDTEKSEHELVKEIEDSGGMNVSVDIDSPDEEDEEETE